MNVLHIPLWLLLLLIAEVAGNKMDDKFVIMDDVEKSVVVITRIDRSLFNQEKVVYPLAWYTSFMLFVFCAEFLAHVLQFGVYEIYFMGNNFEVLCSVCVCVCVFVWGRH